MTDIRVDKPNMHIDQNLPTRSVLETVTAPRMAIFPKPRERTPDVPIGLETICLKTMARNPQGRYDSAIALADDVERWMAGCEISAM